MVELIDIEVIAERLQGELLKETQGREFASLASVWVGESLDAESYIKGQKKLAEKVGIDFCLFRVSDQVSQEEAIAKIKEIDENKRVGGIIINKPFPKNWNPEDIFSAISLDKDIEGASPYNLGKIFYGKPAVIPPTALSVLAILDSLRVDFYGKNITLVGFSTLIGKPLALLLGQKLATVSITHIATYEKENLPFYIANSDILISAVGKPGVIRGSWIKKGAIVIDVGIAKKEDKLTGDIEFQEIAKRAAYLTPVPGGVGRLTSLFLLKNFLKVQNSIGRKK